MWTTEPKGLNPHPDFTHGPQVSHFSSVKVVVRVKEGGNNDRPFPLSSFYVPNTVITSLYKFINFILVKP